MIKIDPKFDEGLDEQLTIQMDENIYSFFFKFLIQIICRLNIMCIAILIIFFNNFLTVYLFILYLNFICKTIPLDFDLCENFISKERKNSS